MKRPAITMCHAKMNGEGTAIRLELHPARLDVEGSILATIAPQKAMKPVASFEWNNSISVRLDFLDIAKILQVFRGQYESIDDGKGLYHRTTNGCTVVRLTHRIEPVVGYVLDVSHNPNDGGEIVSMHFDLNECEAFALAETISQSMPFVAFGVPSNK